MENYGFNKEEMARLIKPFRMRVKTPLRYPGGKSRAIKFLNQHLPNTVCNYREPFLGGGSMALWIAQRWPQSNIWVNDAHWPLYAFWSQLQARGTEMAKELELDLVEISPKAVPPVCKIVDYQKFLYEQKKRDKVMKSKATKVIVKEIRFGPQTDEHDYEFKKKHAVKFLQDGAKLKAFVFFKGRSIIFKEQGQILLLKLAQELEEYGKVEQLPKLEGKRMIMFIAPKKAK